MRDYLAQFLLVTRVFWGFDGTLKDLYNTYNGVGQNGPTFRSPGYNGAGSCLWLNASLLQLVTVTDPFLIIAYKSFTVEAWIYANTIRYDDRYPDRSILAQHQIPLVDRSFHLVIRDQQAYLGFANDDLTGSQVRYDD